MFDLRLRVTEEINVIGKPWKNNIMKELDTMNELL